MKLASQGVFADGHVNEYLGTLRRAWPAARDRQDLDEHGFWFFSDAPFGWVWISPEGGSWS
ncbi:DUF596 domain-containing protein [Stenotrophomonas maltophilia]|uniref:DUF596 domain-containing protein n=1 Tax=Stenotrophomonas TaxID=40323 RepID=UPI0009B51732|nr:DUF596 domain-containing protein [Stenotrophomonas maltophilia]NMT34316.1 DUF596 domain-containing protein [Stenotrophomonas maltophilia]NMT71923.1 DUF596 domain-containing protein [Stenotrophomonas maltophilia]TNX96115.1 DUF596 domain-containing protein [Stenotrophomonas maltophilia]TPD77740.1 DUF596 domain-containing protein [Stenotrophomonas maltophilia]